MKRIRYQTGEINEVIKEMEEDKIPCIDVVDDDEFKWTIIQLESKNIIKDTSIENNRNARDRLKEPEFEYRIAFKYKNLENNIMNNKIMFIDFYYEPIIEETY